MERSWPLVSFGIAAEDDAAEELTRRSGREERRAGKVELRKRVKETGGTIELFVYAPDDKDVLICFLSNSSVVAGRVVVVSGAIMEGPGKEDCLNDIPSPPCLLLLKMTSKLVADDFISALRCGGSRFDRKVDKTSSDVYFYYYSMLSQQQNMMQDLVRTGTYQSAILNNKDSDFRDKTVLDCGAGSAILSLFAIQAGASVVYAVEASAIAGRAERLCKMNTAIGGGRVKVVRGKIEEIDIPVKVDTIISEPMGTLLVNERMLESYVIARDRFLKPGGKMFPSSGRIFCAPFCDVQLHNEMTARAQFWNQTNFFGVDLRPLYHDAYDSYFSQVIVDAFEPNILVAMPCNLDLDFMTINEDELYSLRIPLHFEVQFPCTITGIACWFDVLFDGSTSQQWLTTAPGAPTTHWYQLRCCMKQPIQACQGQIFLGELLLQSNSRQSYDIHLDFGGQSQAFDLKDPYYRASQPIMQPYLSPANA